MIQEILRKQREFYLKGSTKSYNFRMNQLELLKEAIKKYEKRILEALYRDLRKPAFEAYTNEVGYVLESIDYIQKHLKKWMKKDRVKTPIHQFLSRSYIEYIPYGQTLIIGPFNYPFQLVVEPLIGAIAGGNTCILKPSEYTKAVESLLVEMIEETFDASYIAIVTGEKDITKQLLESPFDYIFFTGSVAVGKIVMKAAAERLTPLTLELGGKSPAIVDETAKIDLAAQRIAGGKFLNAGQTCVAPDFVYVHTSIERTFKSAVIKYIKEFYGDNPSESEDYGRIVSKRHYDRLKNFVEAANVFSGGRYLDDHLYIEPSLIDNVQWSDPIMQEEIFGPLLPILTYDDLDDLISILQGQDNPLALYVFSENKDHQEKILKMLSFGGGAINDTISHVASPYLPFGGIHTSGMGVYHGKYSFKAFTHPRSILVKSSKVKIPLVFPPYKNKIKLAKKIMK
jgi:aldehyde dehydrogenase (NAD+)